MANLYKTNSEEYKRIKRQNQMYELQDANSGNYVSWESLQEVNHYTPEKIYDKIAPNIYVKVDLKDKVKKLNSEIAGKQAVIDEYSKEKELADELSDLKRAYRLRFDDINSLKEDLKYEKSTNSGDAEKIKALEGEVARLNKKIEDNEVPDLLKKITVDLEIPVYDVERFQKIGQQVESIKTVGRKALDEVNDLKLQKEIIFRKLGVKDLVDMESKLKGLVEKGKGQTNEIERWKNDLIKTKQSLQGIEQLSNAYLNKRTETTLADLKAVKAGSYRRQIKIWMKDHDIEVPEDEDDEKKLLEEKRKKGFRTFKERLDEANEKIKQLEQDLERVRISETDKLEEISRLEKELEKTGKVKVMLGKPKPTNYQKVKELEAIAVDLKKKLVVARRDKKVEEVTIRDLSHQVDSLKATAEESQKRLVDELQKQINELSALRDLEVVALGTDHQNEIDRLKERLARALDTKLALGVEDFLEEDEEGNLVEDPEALKTFEKMNQKNEELQKITQEFDDYKKEFNEEMKTMNDDLIKDVEKVQKDKEEIETKLKKEIESEADKYFELEQKEKRTRRELEESKQNLIDKDTQIRSLRDRIKTLEKEIAFGMLNEQEINLLYYLSDFIRKLADKEMGMEEIKQAKVKLLEKLALDETAEVRKEKDEVVAKLEKLLREKEEATVQSAEQIGKIKQLEEEKGALEVELRRIKEDHKKEKAQLEEKHLAKLEGLRQQCEREKEIISKENERLVARVEALSGEISVYQREREEATGNYNQKEDDFINLLNELRTKLKENQITINELKEKNAEFNSNQEDFTTTQTEKDEEFNRLNKLLEDERGRFNNLNTLSNQEKEKLSARINELQVASERKNETEKRYQRTIQQHLSKIEDLSNAVKNNETLSQQEKDSHQRIINDLEGIIKGNEDTIHNLDTAKKVEQKEKQAKILKRSSEEIRRKYKEASREKENYESVKSQIVQLKGQIESLAHSSDEEKTRLSKECQKQTEQINELERLDREKEKANTDLKNQLENTATNLKKQIVDLTTEKEEVKNALSSRVKDLEEELDNSKKGRELDVKTLREENTKLMNQVNSLTNTGEEMTNRFKEQSDALNAKITLYEQSINDYQGKIKELEETNGSLQRQIINIEEKCKQEHKRLEKSISDLKKAKISSEEELKRKIDILSESKIRLSENLNREISELKSLISSIGKTKEISEKELLEQIEILNQQINIQTSTSENDKQNLKSLNQKLIDKLKQREEEYKSLDISLKEKTKKLQDEIDNLQSISEKEKRDLESRINDLNKELVGERDTGKVNEEALQSKTEQLEQTIEDLNLEKKERERLQELLNSHGEKLSAKLAKIQELKGLVKERNEMLGSLETEIKKIRGREEANKKLYQEKVDELSRKLNEAIQAKSGKEEEEKELQKRISGLEQLIITQKRICNEEKKGLQDSIDSLTGSGVQREEHLREVIRDLEDKLTTANSVSETDKKKLLAEVKTLEGKEVEYKRVKEELSGKVRELDNANTELKSQVSKLESEGGISEKEKKDLLGMIKELEETNSQKQNQIAGLQENIENNLKKRIEELQRNVNNLSKAKETDKNNLQQEIEKLKEKFKAVNKTNSDYKKKIEELELEVDRQKGVFEKYKEENDADRLEETNNLLREVDSLRKELKETEFGKQVDIQVLKGKIEELKDASEKEKKELTDEMAKLESQLNNALNSSSSYQSKVAEVEQAKEKITKELQDKIKGLEEELNDLKKTQLTTQSATKEVIDNLTEQLVTANTQNTELNGLIKGFEDQKASLERKLKDKMEQERKLQDNLRRVRYENNERIENLKQQNRTSQDTLMSEMGRLVTKISFLEKQLEQDQNVSRSRERSNEELINDLQAKLKESRGKELTEKEKKVIEDLDLLLYYFAYFIHNEGIDQAITSGKQVQDFIEQFPNEYDAENYPNLSPFISEDKEVKGLKNKINTQTSTSDAIRKKLKEKLKELYGTLLEEKIQHNEQLKKINQLFDPASVSYGLIDFNGMYDGLNKVFKKKDGEILELQKQEVEVKYAKEELSKRLQECEKHGKTLQTKVNELLNIIETKNKELQNKDDEYLNKKSENDNQKKELQEKIAELQIKVAEDASAIGRLEQALSDLQQNNADNINLLNLTRNKENELLASVKGLEEERAGIQKMMDNYLREIETKTQETREQKRLKEEFRRELENIKKKVLEDQEKEMLKDLTIIVIGIGNWDSERINRSSEELKKILMKSGGGKYPNLKDFVGQFIFFMKNYALEKQKTEKELLNKTQEVNDYLNKIKELQEKVVDANKLMNALKIHRSNRAFYSHKTDFTKAGGLDQHEFFTKEMPNTYYFAMPDINEGTKLVSNKNIVFDKPGLTRHVYVGGNNVHGANLDVEVFLNKTSASEGFDKNVVKIGIERFQGLRNSGENHDIPYRSFHPKTILRRY
ncbi:10359_t:CDS:10 [Funneliformis geosporum]|nr:10359_t:CDS:10 [Funneliformis geosporum]